MNFTYWVYFDKVGQPEKFVVKNLLELTDIIGRMVEQIGEMPEWIIRSYR
jgi:hypothetical protein